VTQQILFCFAIDELAGRRTGRARSQHRPVDAAGAICAYCHRRIHFVSAQTGWVLDS
jgi:hypothetical protein